MFQLDDPDIIWTLDEDGNLFMWPRCKVKGCPNGKCYALESPYCYPHSMNGTLKAIDKPKKKGITLQQLFAYEKDMWEKDND